MSEVYQILRKSTGAVSFCLPDEILKKCALRGPHRNRHTEKSAAKKAPATCHRERSEKKAYEKEQGALLFFGISQMAASYEDALPGIFTPSGMIMGVWKTGSIMTFAERPNTSRRFCSVMICSGVPCAWMLPFFMATI